jgi:hypothetical protein
MTETFHEGVFPGVEFDRFDVGEDFIHESGPRVFVLPTLVLEQKGRKAGFGGRTFIC